MCTEDALIDKSKGGDTRELQSRMVPPKKTGSSHLKGEKLGTRVGCKGPIVYYVPGGGGGGVQFLKRVNFGGSVLKMYKV